jgi:hypothetical protein
MTPENFATLLRGALDLMSRVRVTSMSCCAPEGQLKRFCAPMSMRKIFESPYCNVRVVPVRLRMSRAFDESFAWFAATGTQ